MTAEGVMDVMTQLWGRGADPQAWAKGTTPDENLIWKAEHPSQVKDLLAIGHLLDLPVKVVGEHRSKSVRLPIGMFEAGIYTEEKVYFLTRNNFYNLKLVVVSSCPINIDYDVVYTHMTQEQYDKEKRRCYEYCGPKPDRGLPAHKGFREEDYETDAWYDDWTSDTLLRVDGKIYRCGTTSAVYYEGINAVAPCQVWQRYEHGRTEFAIEIQGEEIELMGAVRAVVRSAKSFVEEKQGS
jgi:hypothetical protein